MPVLSVDYYIFYTYVWMHEHVGTCSQSNLCISLAWMDACIIIYRKPHLTYIPCLMAETLHRVCMMWIEQKSDDNSLVKHWPLCKVECGEDGLYVIGRGGFVSDDREPRAEVKMRRVDHWPNCCSVPRETNSHLCI